MKQPSSALYRDLFLLLVWLCVIFTWSTSAGAAPHTNSWVDALLGRLFPHWYGGLTWPEHDAIHYYIRKAAHVTEYAVLGVLAVRALRHSPLTRRPVLLAAWLFATLYAVTDEAHQIYVAGRTPKGTDVMLDSLGAAIGIALYVLFTARRARRLYAGKSPLTAER